MAAAAGGGWLLDPPAAERSPLGNRNGARAVARGSQVTLTSGAPAGVLHPSSPALLYRKAPMTLSIEFEQEADGRWFAEVPSLPGVMTYGNTRTDAGARVQAMALRVLAERLEHGEAVPELLNVTFHAA